jgi:hypothetical protein
VEGSEQAERHAEDEADRRCAEAHRERMVRAGQHAGEHVAAELVGPEPMLGGGWQQPLAHGEALRVERRDPGAQHREQRDGADDHTADHQRRRQARTLRGRRRAHPAARPWRMRGFSTA